MERTSSQVNGIVVLANLKYYNFVHYDRNLLKTVAACLGYVFPIYTKAVHFAHVSTRSTVNMILPLFRQEVGKHIRRRLGIHLGSDQEILASLADYSIYAQNVPPCLGGNLTNNSLRDIRMDRQQFEMERKYNSSTSHHRKQDHV